MNWGPIYNISYDHLTIKKGKGSAYSIAERRVPALIPVLGSHYLRRSYAFAKVNCT